MPAGALEAEATVSVVKNPLFDASDELTLHEAPSFPFLLPEAP